MGFFDWRIGNMRISLTALRAFESTARLSSMSMAAAELRVGLASVSRHVSALQARLGVELLRREGRRVVLTPAGRAYFADITTAFRSINSATESIAAEAGPRGPRLTVACDRSLAQRWLLPRLAGFCASVPGLSLSVIDPFDADEDAAAADVTVSFRRVQLDTAAEEITLCEPPMLVLASAAMAGNPGTTAALLRSAPLIHARSRDLWRDWLSMARHAGEMPRMGIIMPDKSLAIGAAAEGMGVALACSMMAEPEIQSGRCRVLLGRGHVLGRYVAMRSQRPAVDIGLTGRFVDWLRDEMSATVTTAGETSLLPA
jgi:LysR family glycine cleavage system transcriptional activator